MMRKIKRGNLRLDDKTCRKFGSDYCYCRITQNTQAIKKKKNLNFRNRVLGDCRHLSFELSKEKKIMRDNIYIKKKFNK